MNDSRVMSELKKCKKYTNLSELTASLRRCGAIAGAKKGQDVRIFASKKTLTKVGMLTAA